MEFENMTFWQWLTITWDSIVKNGSAGWIITIITVWILIKQIKQNEEFNRQTYEMQRRVNAANTLFQWSINSKVEETISKRVVEKFSEDEVRKLLNEESFKIKKEHYEKISFILRNANINIKSDNCRDDSNNSCSELQEVTSNKCEDCVNKDMIELNKEAVVLLRAYVMHYLNNLEVLLLQCKISTVDQDIFFEQLKYQYNTRDGVMALKKVRNAVGGIEAYPAIEWFCTKLEEKMKSDILEKENVDADNKKGNIFIEFLIKNLNKLK